MAGKKGVPIPRCEESFKLGAIKLVVEGGRSPKEVADELGVPVDTVKTGSNSLAIQRRFVRKKSIIKKAENSNLKLKVLKKQLGKKNGVIEVLRKSIGIMHHKGIAFH